MAHRVAATCARSALRPRNAPPRHAGSKPTVAQLRRCAAGSAHTLGLTGNRRCLAAPVAAYTPRRFVASGNVQEDVIDVEALESLAGPSSPGEADKQRFQLHPSVEHWREWYYDDAIYQSTPELIAGCAQRIASIVSNAPGSSTTTGAAYWAYHSVRNAFFATQGLASILYADLQQQSRNQQGKSESSYPIDSGARARLMVETYETFKQDLTNIHEGVYKLPWDMTSPTHRQYNPLFVLNKAAEFVLEANATLGRRKMQRPEEVWMQSNMYPDYYLATFHFQTDGWLSSKSASVYETSTETLFLGRQDAMQRQTLVPIQRWLQENKRDPSSMKLLEVGCGTGRFHTFIKDNYPSMKTAALDLSPFYLQKARRNVEYWGQTTGNDASNTTFLHAAAESIPLSDGLCDMAVSVYLYHEMPREAQEAATREMARVLKPGGLLVITDSIQRGDRPILDNRITNFQRFNEPYYLDYVETNLGEMFCNAGLQPFLKNMVSSTKVLSFIKPME